MFFKESFLRTFLLTFRSPSASKTYVGSSVPKTIRRLRRGGGRLAAVEAALALANVPMTTAVAAPQLPAVAAGAGGR